MKYYIPIASAKPVFIRNVFLEEKAYDDILGLGEELSNYFRKVSSKGAAAEYIFVDVNKFDNAYAVKVIYKVTGDKVVFNRALFKGGKKVDNLSVTGRKSDIKGMVDEIVSEVEWLLDF